MTTFAKTDIADVDNVNIEAILPLVTPAELKNELPLSPKAIETVTKGRETVRDILDGKDKRLLMVIGPARFMTSTLPMNTPINCWLYPKKLKTVFMW